MKRTLSNFARCQDDRCPVAGEHSHPVTGAHKPKPSPPPASEWRRERDAQRDARQRIRDEAVGVATAAYFGLPAEGQE